MNIVYDPIQIDYNPEDSEPTEKDKKRHYLRKTGYLTEMYVDPGYELESVSPKHLIYLDKLRDRFLVRGNDPIAFIDLKAALYKIGNELRTPISDFQIIAVLRELWRAGYIRRYIKGRSRSRKVGRGEFYGIHYSLYPKREK